MSTLRKGFTLIELIIVITILAILSTVAFVSFQNAGNKTDAVSDKTTLRAYATALTHFNQEAGTYPKPFDSNGVVLADHTTIGYLSSNSSMNAKMNNYTTDTNGLYSIRGNKIFYGQDFTGDFYAIGVKSGEEFLVETNLNGVGNSSLFGDGIITGVKYSALPAITVGTTKVNNLISIDALGDGTILMRFSAGAPYADLSSSQVGVDANMSINGYSDGFTVKTYSQGHLIIQKNVGSFIVDEIVNFSGIDPENIYVRGRLDNKL